MIDFLEPSAAIYLLSVVLSIVLSFYYFFSVRSRLDKLNRLPLSSPKFVIKGIVHGSILLLLCVALLRPYTGFEDVEVDSSGQDNLVLFDISYSMLAKDLTPSRLVVAKRKVLDLLTILSQNKSAERIGIILFAGQAYLYCPLTEDFGTAKEFIKNISPDLITAQGSGINQALDVTAAVLKRAKSKNSRIFIFSDGEDLGFNVERAKEVLLENNIKPLILGFGTAEGSPIDLGNREFLKDQNGEIVMTKLREDVLTEIANSSAGVFRVASFDDSDIRELVNFNNNLNLLPQETRIQKTIRVYHEQGANIAVAILVLLSGLMLFGKRSWIFVLFLFLIPNRSHAAPTLREAYEHYQAEKYEDAKKEFEYFQNMQPEDLDIMQALASTYYKLGDYKKASRLFEKLYRDGTTGKQKFDAAYNLGNTKFMSKEYEEAVSEYAKALEIKKDDEKARHNLELAKKLLQEQKEEKKNQNKEQDRKDQQNQEQNSERNSKSSEEENPQPSPNSESGSKSENKDPLDNREPEDHMDNRNGKGSEPSSQEQPMNNLQEGVSNAEQAQKEISSLDAKGLEELEAKQWLQSLPDAPVLLQKKSERLNTGQQW